MNMMIMKLYPVKIMVVYVFTPHLGHVPQKKVNVIFMVWPWMSFKSPHKFHDHILGPL